MNKPVLDAQHHGRGLHLPALLWRDRLIYVQTSTCMRSHRCSDYINENYGFKTKWCGFAHLCTCRYELRASAVVLPWDLRSAFPRYAFILGLVSISKEMNVYSCLCDWQNFLNILVKGITVRTSVYWSLRLFVKSNGLPNFIRTERSLSTPEICQNVAVLSL